MSDRLVAVVTGAASGIGREVALRLSKLGYDLVAIDADADGLESLRDAVKTPCSAHRTDVSEADGWDNVVHELQGRRVGVLVNCAGLLLAGKLTDCQPEDLRRIVDVNLGGVMLGCRAIVPLLAASAPRVPKPQRQLPVGVLNVASIFAPLSPPGFAAYNATKAGVVALSDTLRGEVGGDGLTVTAVLPGATRTGLFTKAHYANDRFRQATREFVAGAELTAGEVAGAALKAFRRRKRRATIGRRAARYAFAMRWAPTLTGWSIARRARRALEAG